MSFMTAVKSYIPFGTATTPTNPKAGKSSCSCSTKVANIAVLYLGAKSGYEGAKDLVHSYKGWKTGTTSLQKDVDGVETSVTTYPTRKQTALLTAYGALKVGAGTAAVVAVCKR